MFEVIAAFLLVVSIFNLNHQQQVNRHLQQELQQVKKEIHAKPATKVTKPPLYIDGMQIENLDKKHG